MIKKIGIILHGATGNICSSQHLANALGPIRAEGGLMIVGENLVPDLVLIGRNGEKLQKIARANKVENWTTDLETALSDPKYSIFFDGAATHSRIGLLRRAIEAGKHIYSEKPVAPSVADGLEILGAVGKKGLKHGAVQDKIHTPGFRKMAKLVRDGFFGRIVGFSLNFVLIGCCFTHF